MQPLGDPRFSLVNLSIKIATTAHNYSSAVGLAAELSKVLELRESS